MEDRRKRSDTHYFEGYNETRLFLSTAVNITESAATKQVTNFKVVNGPA
jgi:hypothetical protein